MRWPREGSRPDKIMLNCHLLLFRVQKATLLASFVFSYLVLALSFRGYLGFFFSSGLWNSLIRLFLRLKPLSTDLKPEGSKHLSLWWRHCTFVPTINQAATFRLSKLPNLDKQCGESLEKSFISVTIISHTGWLRTKQNAHQQCFQFVANYVTL